MTETVFNPERWDKEARAAGLNTTAHQGTPRLSFGRGPFTYVEGELQVRIANAEQSYKLEAELMQSEEKFLAVHRWLLEQGEIVCR